LGSDGKKAEKGAFMMGHALKTVLAITCGLLVGCAKNEKKTVTGPIDKPDDKPVVVLDRKQTTGASAASMHKNLSSLDKIGKVMEGPSGKTPKVEVGLKSIGGSKAAPAVGAKSKIAPPAKGGKTTIVGALLKSGSGLAKIGLTKQGLGKVSSRSSMDSAWFTYSDSSKGHVYRIITSSDETADNPYTTRDSTVFQWPYDDELPVVFFSSISYFFADNSIYISSTYDLDGDGILNGAAKGKTSQLNKLQVSITHDTVSRYWTREDHGIATNWSDMGEGSPMGASDTTTIKGKITSYTTTKDADGDGFLNFALQGEAKVATESYSVLEDGSISTSSALYGPGSDKDYNLWEDNVYYPFTSTVLGPKLDTLSHSLTSDGDGDGILNGYAQGKSTEIKRITRSFTGDTLSIGITYTSYGKGVLWDSLGDGQLNWSADSTFANGKPIWWQTTKDGDGDGFAFTSAPGKTAKVDNNSWSRSEDGSSYAFYNSYGIGPDKDYYLWEDNEQYPSMTVNLGAKGDTLSKTVYDDADGDSFYYAKGATNKVSEWSYYANQEGYKTYRDSVIKMIGDIATNDDDKVGFYTASVDYLNGSTSLITTKAKNGKDVFGEKDTIEVNERYTYTNYIPTSTDDNIGDQDSALVVTWMIPKELSTNDDDEIIYWSDKIFYKKTLPLYYTATIVTAKVPFLASQDPLLGTTTQEQKFNGVADLDVVKYYRLDEFDHTKNTASWREVNTFKNGDSTFEVGNQISANIGTYSSQADKETRNSGWYNTLTNEFKDTTVYLNAKDKELSKDISFGMYKDEDSTCDYSSKQIYANGDTSLTRTVKVKEKADVFRVTTTDNGVTSIYRMHKDTTSWEQSDSTSKTSFSSITREDGSYSVLQSTIGVPSGATLAKGTMTFFADGSGDGTITDFVDGKEQTPVKLKFDADGTTYIDGVKVPDEGATV
jgi:hypothetical protein